MISLLKKNTQVIFVILLVLISIGAGIYIATCTKYAPWGFSDSAAYLSAARNFAAGKGLGLVSADGHFAPLLIFAPLYSVVLSVFNLFKADLITTARTLDVAFFATLVAACGWLFYLITRSFWGSLGLALMIATTPTLGIVFTSIMSDPLAMVLGTTGFLLLIYALRQNSAKWLAVSALLAALSLLTRYAYVAFPITGALSLMLLSPNKFKKRLADTLKYGLISLSPMLILIVLQLFTKNSVGSRTYSFDFSFVDKLTGFTTQVFSVLKYWLPYRTNMIPGVSADVFRPILLLFFALIILFGLFLGIKKSVSSEPKITGFLSIGFVLLILVYLVVLFVTYLVSTEIISIDDRMLSPILPIFYALILSCSLSVGQAVMPRISIPFIAVVVAIFFVVFNYQPFKAYPIVVGDFPNGYTAPIWKENRILTGEVTLPTNRPIITNAPDIVLFYLNRSAFVISHGPDAETGTLSVDSASSLEEMLHQKCAWLVLFDAQATQRFEQLANPISNADILLLQNQTDTLHSSANGTILADNKCNP